MHWGTRSLSHWTSREVPGCAGLHIKGTLASKCFCYLWELTSPGMGGHFRVSKTPDVKASEIQKIKRHDEYIHKWFGGVEKCHFSLSGSNRKLELVYPFLVSFQKWFLSLIWGIKEWECESGGERPELYLCIWATEVNSLAFPGGSWEEFSESLD